MPRQEEKKVANPSNLSKSEFSEIYRQLQEKDKAIKKTEMLLNKGFLSEQDKAKIKKLQPLKGEIKVLLQ